MHASSTSTQCRTGVSLPLCRCVMHPMLADTITVGWSWFIWPRLAVAQRTGQLRIQDRVRTGGAAAQMGLALRLLHAETQRAGSFQRRRAASVHAGACDV